MVMVFSLYLTGILKVCESWFLNDYVRQLIYFFSSSGTYYIVFTCLIAICSMDSYMYEYLSGI